MRLGVSDEWLTEAIATDHVNWLAKNSAGIHHPAYQPAVLLSDYLKYEYPILRGDAYTDIVLCYIYWRVSCTTRLTKQTLSVP